MQVFYTRVPCRDSMQPYTCSDSMHARSILTGSTGQSSSQPHAKDQKHPCQNVAVRMNIVLLIFPGLFAGVSHGAENTGLHQGDAVHEWWFDVDQKTESPVARTFRNLWQTRMTDERYGFPGLEAASKDASLSILQSLVYSSMDNTGARAVHELFGLVGTRFDRASIHQTLALGGFSVYLSQSFLTRADVAPSPGPVAFESSISRDKKATDENALRHYNELNTTNGATPDPTLIAIALAALSPTSPISVDKSVRAERTAAVRKNWKEAFSSLKYTQNAFLSPTSFPTICIRVVGFSAALSSVDVHVGIREAKGKDLYKKMIELSRIDDTPFLLLVEPSKTPLSAFISTNDTLRNQLVIMTVLHVDLEQANEERLGQLEELISDVAQPHKSH